MKFLVTLAILLSFGNSHCQSNQNFYKDTINYDSVRHIRFFTLDSTLFKISVFKYDLNSDRYKIKQGITFSKNGMVKTFHAVYDMSVSEDGYILTDEIIVNLDENGKPKKVWWVDKFRLFKAYIFDKEKDKYRRIKL